MIHPLLALDFVAPVIGGAVLAGAVSFFGGALLAKREPDEATAPLDERRMQGLEDEIQRLNRERISARFEEQVLKEAFAHHEISQVLSNLLNQIVPQPLVNFAAIVGASKNAQFPTMSRGMSEVSSKRLFIPAELTRRLKTESQVVIRLQTDEFGIYSVLDDVDRFKAPQLILTAFEDNDDPYAVLVSSSFWPSGLHESEQLNLVKRIVRQIGSRWKQALLVEEQSRELRSTQVMLDLKSIVATQTDEPQEVLERFANRLCESVHADRVAIYFVARRSGEELQPIVQCGRKLPVEIESIWQQHERALANTTIESRVGSIYDAEWLKNVQIDPMITSAATMPICIKGRILGALCLTQRGQAGAFAKDRALIDFAAETLSQTLRRVFDEATIRRQARHDHLTDLVNRRSFDAYLATEVERVRSGDAHECSMIFADLDRFKSYNDRYGHLAGDQILREAARVLADQVSHLRLGERSIVARYGGEEFAILLPNVGLAGALRIAEGIRAAIERERIKIQEIEVEVTISLGVANFPVHARSVDSLIAIADKALYLAKENGRNRVCQPPEANSV